MELKFDENGLIPAIVQDHETKQVLTLAYMNRESLDITVREGRTCFWSRSRQELWRKGETSGNIQHIVNIIADCDSDALLIEVQPEGPACHTGSVSCFESVVHGELSAETESPISVDGEFDLSTLYSLLTQRHSERPEGSYTTYLFDKGREKILKKIGEECSEVIIGAMKGDKAETVYELADLCYHALVLMVSENITTEDVLAELASRHILDNKVKQETMGG